MFKHALPLVAVLALAACEGSSPNPVNGTGVPDDTGTDPDVDPVGIPEELAQDLDGIGFDIGDPNDPSDDTIIVEGVNLDDTPFQTVYSRNQALDVPGYSAFVAQDDRLDRIFVAVAAESPDGSVRAGSVSDGGQFNRFFRGNFYERDGAFTPPNVDENNGLVSYAGLYAGITNLDDLDQDQSLPNDPTDPGETRPIQPRQTTGNVFVNVDFADNAVNGTIYDRQFTDGKQLASLTLIPTELDENGEFIGDVEFSGRPDVGDQGEYGGIIGGEEGSSLAGVLVLDNIFVPDESDPEDTQFDAEVGTFVLPKCGTDGESDICDGLGD